MSNIFERVGVSIADCGKWLATAIKDTVKIADRVERILKTAKPLEQPFISALSTVVADLETLVAASDSAVTADGLNFPADSRVYSDFLTLISDFRKLAPIVDEAIKAIET